MTLRLIFWGMMGDDGKMSKHMWGKDWGMLGNIKKNLRNIK
jgi:hypothetical protein